MITSLRQRLSLAATVVGIVAAIFIYREKGPAPAANHVFINETADHRFDESIQVSILAAFQRTHVQNAVVITDRFASIDFEKTAARLFTDLQLGRANQGRAILYLFSPAANALKIEVGYALEGVLPDAQVRALELAAKSFTFNDHYQDFWAELINTLNIEVAKKEVPTSDHEVSADFSKFRYASGGAGISSKEYDTSIDQLERETRAAPAANTFKADASVQTSVQNYLESLHQGIGATDLDVLHPDSRLFRRFTPFTTYQLYRNWKMATDAGIEKIVEADDLAFVFFKVGQPVLPLVFVRDDDVWRAHEPLSWALFQRFEDSMQVFLKFPLLSKSAELNQYLARSFRKPLYPAPLVDLRTVLASSPNQISDLYFKFYWLDRVMPLLANTHERGLLWLSLDVANNLGQFSRYLEIMATLVALYPKDAKLKHDYEFYRTTYRFTGPDWQLTLK